MLRIALPGVLLVCALLPSAASAARPTTAKFEATFEAKRVVTWDQPRGVTIVDCKGEHFHQEKGSETWEMRGKPQKLLVQGGVGRGMTLWRFGTWNPSSVSGALGLEAKGPRVRGWTVSGGTTGGWCRPGLNVDAPPESDCGTRLSEQVVSFSHIGGTVLFNHGDAPWAQREKLGFDTCLLVTPDKVAETEFPKVGAQLPVKRLLGREKKIVLTGSKDFGPTVTPVPNTSVNRTASASVSWKLTLVRKK
jgi:hypothetical protein